MSPRLPWAAALLLGCGSSPAAEYLVDQFAIDAVDAAPGDGACSASLAAPPSGGQCTLRAAVMEANANPGPDTVLVPWRDPVGIPAFESLGFPVSEPIVLDLEGADDTAMAGDLDILDDINISISPQAAVLGWSTVWDQILPIIDASALGDRIFDIRGGVGEVRISGLILTEGDAASGPGGAIHVAPNVTQEVTLLALDLVGNAATTGAAIASSSPLSLINSRVRDNVSANHGSAVIGYATRLTVGLSSLFGNASTGAGAAVEIRSQGVDAGELRVLSSAIVDNATSALLVAGDALMEIQGSTLTGNTQYGLLTRVFPASPAPRIALSHTVLANQGLANCRIDEEVLPALQLMDDFNFEDTSTCEQLVLGASNQHGVAPGLSGPAPDPRSWHFVDLPLPGSPLIDAGSTTAVAIDDFGCVPFDIRLRERPRAGQAGIDDPRCDIGAIEFLPDAIFSDGME